MYVLIADDEIDIGYCYKKILERAGHEVVLSGSGEGCLKLYDSHLRQCLVDSNVPRCNPFDAVILDYRMPDMNGVEAAKAILAMNPEQRIVFVSAFVKESMIKDVERIKRKDMHLLERPISAQKLISLIEKAGC